MLQTNTEDAKDDADQLSKSALDAKPNKDRKNRKDKVKPLAKVRIYEMPSTRRHPTKSMVFPTTITINNKTRLLSGDCHQR